MKRVIQNKMKNKRYKEKKRDKERIIYEILKIIGNDSEKKLAKYREMKYIITMVSTQIK